MDWIWTILFTPFHPRFGFLRDDDHHRAGTTDPESMQFSLPWDGSKIELESVLTVVFYFMRPEHAKLFHPPINLARPTLIQSMLSYDKSVVSFYHMSGRWHLDLINYIRPISAAGRRRRLESGGRSRIICTYADRINCSFSPSTSAGLSIIILKITLWKLKTITRNICFCIGPHPRLHLFGRAALKQNERMGIYRYNSWAWSVLVK